MAACGGDDSETGGTGGTGAEDDSSSGSHGTTTTSRGGPADGPGITEAVEAAGGRSSRRTPRLDRAPAVEHRRPDRSGCRRPDPACQGPRSDRAGLLWATTRHPGHRVRPPDRGRDVFYITFNNERVGTIIAEEITAAGPGATTRSSRATPLTRMPSSCATAWNGSARPGHRDRLRGQQRRLGDRATRANMEAASGQPTTTSRPSCPRTTAWHRRRGRAPGRGPGYLRSADRTATTPPSTGCPGAQTVSVWKDALQLGHVAGEVAVQLYNGTPMNEIDVSNVDIADYAAPPAGTARRPVRHAG